MWKARGARDLTRRSLDGMAGAGYNTYAKTTGNVFFFNKTNDTVPETRPKRYEMECLFSGSKYFFNVRQCFGRDAGFFEARIKRMGEAAMQFAKRCVSHVRKVIIRDQRRRRRKRKRAYQARILPEALALIASKALEFGLNREARERKITVSLASYPARFKTLDVVLKRLLDQTMKPDRLILYLDDFTHPSEVPGAVLDLTRYGLEIRYVPHNLKPHKKYFFAMQEYPEDVVITVDDDTVYPRALVETLVASWRRFPDCVSALRAHKITFGHDGKIRPYAEWEWECGERDHPSMRYVATGGCGVLYPPRSIAPAAFDVEAIRETSLNNDDLWLKFMEVETGTRVVICGKQALMDCVELQETQTTSLKEDNVSRGANARCFAALMRRQGRSAKDFRA